MASMRISTFCLVLSLIMGLALLRAAAFPMERFESVTTQQPHETTGSSVPGMAAPERPSENGNSEQQLNQQEEALALLALHEKYSPPNCKYHPLPKSLNSLDFLSENGELLVNDVFGLNGISEHEEQVVSFHVPFGVSDGRCVLSLSFELHRDNYVEFKHVELYARKRNEPPPEAFKRTGASAEAVALRRRGAIQTASVVEGAGGSKTRAVLTAPLVDPNHELIFYLVVGVAPSAGRDVLEPGASSHLLPCHPLRVDLAIVPFARMSQHMPSVCPENSRLPPSVPELTLGDEGLTYASDLSTPLVYSFRGQEQWKPFSKAVFQMTVRVPSRLHRFVRFVVKTAFRFVSGPFQLMLELFEESSPPDASALAPSCALGCLGGTPTFNGQLFDHAMPTGFIYRIWLLAGEPMYLENPDTQCMEFDLSYDVKFESGMTPFDVTAHSWMCKFARLPGLIEQIHQTTEESIGDEERGVVKMHTIDLRDWFGFPPDEIDEMAHQTHIVLQQRSTLRVSAYQQRLSLLLQLTPFDKPQTPLCPAKALAGSNLLSIFCELEPGKYTLAFKASYPLGGIPLCEGFFARIAIHPLQHLEQVYACDSTGAASPPVLFGTSNFSTQKPQSTPFLSLGTIRAKEERNDFVTALIEAPPPAAESSLRSVGGGEFSISDSQDETYLLLGVLSDFSALDVVAVLRQKGAEEVTQVMAFAEAYQQCVPVGVEALLLHRKGGDLSTPDWLCANNKPQLPKAIRVDGSVEFVLDREFSAPSSGHHFLEMHIPARSLVKLSVEGSNGLSPHLVISSKDFPNKPLAEAYGDLFMEADENASGIYVLRMTFSGVSVHCAGVKVHLVVLPTRLAPLCPWARSAGLSPDSLRAAAHEAFSASFDAGIFLPKRVGSDGVEVSLPKDVWLSPSLQPQFPISVTGQATSMRVEITLHPPWIPLKLQLFKKDANSGFRRTPHAVSEYTEHRILFLLRDMQPGEYLLKFFVFDNVELETERLCAHATINAEVGDSDASLMNAVRAELLDIPDLMPVEAPPASLNSRAFLASGEEQIYSTSVYAFPQLASDSAQKEKRSSSGSAVTHVAVKKPTLLRIASEPAVASSSQLRMRLHSSVSPGERLFFGSGEEGAAGKAVSSSPPPSGPVLEDALGDMLALLSPGEYDLHFEASEPFLTTLAAAPVDAVRESLVKEGSSQCAGKTAEQVKLPQPLPLDFDSERFELTFDASAVNDQGELLQLPLHLAAPSVVYAEVGSNFILDFVKVGVAVSEGLWVGEQRGRENKLKLLLDAGVHTLHVLLERAGNSLRQHGDILQAVDIPRCLRFSLHVAVHAAGPSAASAAADCVAYGALPLPLDLSDPESSAALGGPIDELGRLVLRSKAVLQGGAASQQRIALDTKGKDLLLKVGVFLEDHLRAVAVAVHNAEGKAVPPLYDWAVGEGHHERVFRLSPTSGSSLFHLLLNGDGSNCLVFDLFIQTTEFRTMQHMIDCSAMGVESLTPEEAFPSAALSTTTRTLASRVSSPVERLVKSGGAVRQQKEGFLQTFEFEVTEPSFLLAEVGFNFLASHIEVDLVAKASGEGNVLGEPVATGEVDFLQGRDSPVNARQWIATHLDPGKFVLRVADDHFPEQFPQGGEKCFPLTFAFQIHPLTNKDQQPFVVALHPDPTVPLKHGQDLLLLVRLSEPTREKGAVTLRGASGVYVQPAASVRLDSASSASDFYPHVADPHDLRSLQQGAADDAGGFVWSFLFPAEALKSLGPKAVLEMAMRTNNGRPYSLQLIQEQRLAPAGAQEGVTFVIENGKDAAASGVAVHPWSGGRLPAAIFDELQRHREKLLASLSAAEATRRREATADSSKMAVAGRVEEEGARQAIPSSASSSSSATAHLVPPRLSREELIREEEDETPQSQSLPQTRVAAHVAERDASALPSEPTNNNPTLRDDALQRAPGGLGTEAVETLPASVSKPAFSRGSRERLHPVAAEKDVQVECGEGMVWSEEEEICKPEDGDGPSAYLVLAVSVFGFGGLLLLGRKLFQRKTQQPKQRSTEFGRFDLLQMEEDSRLASFDDDDV